MSVGLVCLVVSFVLVALRLLFGLVTAVRLVMIAYWFGLGV